MPVNTTPENSPKEHAHRDAKPQEKGFKKETGGVKEEEKGGNFPGLAAGELIQPIGNPQLKGSENQESQHGEHPADNNRGDGRWGKIPALQQAGENFIKVRKAKKHSEHALQDGEEQGDGADHQHNGDGSAPAVPQGFFRVLFGQGVKLQTDHILISST